MEAKESNDVIEKNPEDFINALSDKFESIKRELMHSLNNSIDSKIDSLMLKLDSGNEPKSYAAVAAPESDNSAVTPTVKPVLLSVSDQSNTQVSKPCEVLVLAPASDDVAKSKAVNDVKKSVTKKLKNVQMTFITANDNSKKISVGFPSTEARESAAAVINEDDFLSSIGYVSKKADKLLPKITIHNVCNDILEGIDTTSSTTEQCRDLEKQIIIEKVLDKNTHIKALVDIDHTFEVVYLNKGKVGNKDLTIAFKVSPAIRATILEKQRGHIYLGGRSYEVSDRFHLKQCYHCQLLGHVSAECPDKANRPTCFYCMGRHTSRDCNYKYDYSKHCCAKCRSSKHKGDVDNSRTHNSASSECPVLIRERQRLANMTDFTSKNVM